MLDRHEGHVIFFHITTAVGDFPAQLSTNAESKNGSIGKRLEPIQNCVTGQKNEGQRCVDTRDTLAEGPSRTEQGSGGGGTICHSSPHSLVLRRMRLGALIETLTSLCAGGLIDEIALRRQSTAPETIRFSVYVLQFRCPIFWQFLFFFLSFFFSFDFVYDPEKRACPTAACSQILSFPFCLSRREKSEFRRDTPSSSLKQKVGCANSGVGSNF